MLKKIMFLLDDILVAFMRVSVILALALFGLMVSLLPQDNDSLIIACIIISAFCFLLFWSLLHNAENGGFLVSGPSILAPEEQTITNHGDTICEVIEGLRSEDVEYSAVFTRSGRKLTETTQFSPYTVTTNLAIDACYGTIHIHNHPGLVEGAFSGQDFLAFIKRKSYTSIVVTRYFLFLLINENYATSCDTVGSIVKMEVDAALRNRLSVILWKCSKSLWRWYTVYISYRTAKSYGFKFQVKSIWMEKVKTCYTKLSIRRKIVVTLGGIACLCTISSWTNFAPLSAKNNQNMEVQCDTISAYDLSKDVVTGYLPEPQ